MSHLMCWLHQRATPSRSLYHLMTDFTKFGFVLTRYDRFLYLCVLKFVCNIDRYTESTDDLRQVCLTSSKYAGPQTFILTIFTLFLLLLIAKGNEKIILTFIILTTYVLRDMNVLPLRYNN